MREIFKPFFKCESGTTAIEYALIAVIVSISTTAVLLNIADVLVEIFNDVLAGFVPA